MMPLLLSLVLAAAESDPYFAWRSPPEDSTLAMDRAINSAFHKGLQRVPRGASCRDAAAAMTTPLASTAQYFFIGPVRRWRIDTTPAAADEGDELDRYSVYRNAPLYPFGHVVPLDPTTSAGGVWFGTDKLGHFFTNGLRSFDALRSAQSRGFSEDEALREAILVGVAEEKGWLGMGVCGIFSFADLHANMAGARFFRALCEDGELVESDGRWVLTVPFSISRWVDPCWDESFAPSAFSATEERELDVALREMCPLLESEAVRERRKLYQARGCAREVTRELAALVASGEAPDPARWSIDLVCR